MAAFASSSATRAEGLATNGIKDSKNWRLAETRRDSAKIEEDTEAVGVLRKAVPIGMLFVVALCLTDGKRHTYGGAHLNFSLSHWLVVFTMVLFLGLTWTRAFRTHWRILSLLCSIAIVATMVGVSAATHDPASRYVTILLTPFATAAFMIWGWRWQLTFIGACLLLYACAEIVAPLGPRFEIHWLLGILAGLTLALYTALFLDRYREKVKRRIRRLDETAAYREAQIVTMTHDIRNPLATLSGLVNLLIENQYDSEQQANLLPRIWSATSSLDLLVKNLLDLFLLEENRLKPYCRIIDPNAIVAEAAERCAIDARLKGFNLQLELDGVTRAKLDPMHLERIVANLLASAVRRTTNGEVRVRSFQHENNLIVEVSDTGPALTPAEIEKIFCRPDLDAEGTRSPALSRYIASSIVATDGGRIFATSGNGWGLRLTVQLPTTIALAA